MLRKLLIAACALGIAAFASSPALATDSGLYVGVGVGQSSTDIDKDDLDEIVVDAFFAARASVLGGNSSLDDSDTSLSLNIGYRFNLYFALEAGYIDLATADYVFSGNINPLGPITSTPASVDVSFESKGFTLAAVATAPIGNVFDIHGRAGLFLASTDFEVNARASGANSSDGVSSDTAEMLLGFGVGFALGEHWHIAVDYTLYSDVGDEEETGEASVTNLAATISFRF